MARFLKLSRMEIQGFKSFYGRTRFDFPHGITAVVGPNGCGKSNIGDAISWVLGEQKASSLRSDRMEDVIFNGSEGRRPLGMAEVSLMFRNLVLLGDNGNGGRPAVEIVEPDGHGNGSPVLRDTGGAPREGTIAIPEAVEASLVSAFVAGEGDAAVLLTDGADVVPLEAAGETGSPDGNGSGRPAFRLEDLPEEVVVTRRIYRSGESEYILNGRRCRLKDVQDLLARTEIGSRLYTTIEQGKIDQILTSKPKDRRGIIEEAAGILGFKVKRRQAEQKLEAATSNLLRISDITGEVEKQINSLKRQAAKARRYRKLLETQRERRRVIAYNRLLALDDDRRVTLEAIGVLEAREAEAAAQTGRVEAEQETVRLRLEEGEEASRRRRDAIHGLDREIDRLQQHLRSDEEQAGDLIRRIEEAGAEIERLAGRLAGQALRGEGLATDLERDRLVVSESGQRLETIATGVRGQITAIEAREAGLEAERGGLAGHLDQLSALTHRRAALEEQERSGRAALQRIDRDALDVRSAMQALRAGVAGLEEETRASRERVGRLAVERGDREHRQAEAAAALGARERQAEEMKGRSVALNDRLASLEELERQHAGYARGVAEILRGAAGFEPEGVAGAFVDVPPGLERAVAAALGGLLEGVLVAGHAEASRGVQHLKSSGTGRASFIPRPGRAADSVGLDPRLREAPGVVGGLRELIGGLPAAAAVESILARTVLVEDLAQALMLHAPWPGWLFVTRDGDLVSQDGVISGGDGPELHHGILARRAEMAALRRQIEELRGTRAEIERLLPELRDRLEAGNERFSAAVSALQAEEKIALERDLQRQQKQGELERNETAVAQMEQERQDLDRQAGERAVEATRLAASITGAEEMRRGLEENIHASSEALAAARRDLAAAQREEAEAGAALAAGRQRLEAIERETAAAAEVMRETGARSARLAADRDDWKGRIAALGEQDTTFRRELDESLGRRAGEAGHEEAAQAGLAYDRSVLHARVQTAREGRAALDGLREQLQERRLHQARLDADRDHLGVSCRGELETTLEGLRAEAPALEEGRTLEDYEAEQEEIRKTLQGIGPVNLMAIEQYGELEERYNFLLTQKKDLEDSIASLRDTVRKINRESRERFLAAFETIQVSFGETFTTLFGGGRAELRLQEGEEDVLEAGVEIAAQPPGKRLQSLALLSGGEKALTAVALLFALFRYRPSPFCVLDEVDAPLDEANVERFTRLLGTLRDDTQFILITHNRKSMEAADLLYGITMEEPGVSKVLPLRFE